MQGLSSKKIIWSAKEEDDFKDVTRSVEHAILVESALQPHERGQRGKILPWSLAADCSVGWGRPCSVQHNSDATNCTTKIRDFATTNQKLVMLLL